MELKYLTIYTFSRRRKKKEKSFRGEKVIILTTNNPQKPVSTQGFTWENIIQQVLEMYLSCYFLFNTKN